MKESQILSVLSTVIVPWAENSKKGSRYNYMRGDSIQISLLEDGSIFFDEKRRNSVAFYEKNRGFILNYYHHYDKETFLGYFSKKFSNEIYQKLWDDAKKRYGVEKIERLIEEIDHKEKEEKRKNLEERLKTPVADDAFLKEYIKILKKHGLKTVGDCLNLKDENFKKFGFPKGLIEEIKWLRDTRMMKSLGFKQTE